MERAGAQLAAISPATVPGDAASQVPARGLQELSRVQADAASGRDRRLVAAPGLRDAALAAAGDDGSGAGDRVREPRQPDARARHRTRARDRRAARDWRVARPDRAATAGGEPAAVGGRRRRRAVHRALAEPVSGRLPRHRNQSRLPEPEHRLACVRVHAGAGGCDVPDLRPDAGDSRHVHGTGVGHEGGQPRIHRFARAVWPAARPGGRASGAVAGARGRRAALRAKPAQSDGPRCRLPAGRRARRQSRPAGRRHAGRRASLLVSRSDGSRPRGSGRGRRGGGVHRPGQRIRLEQQHRHRRKDLQRSRSRGELQQRRSGLLQDHGHAAAGRTRFHGCATLSMHRGSRS